MRLLKGLLYTIVAVLILMAASAAYVTQVLDPNALKPTIVKAAKKHQISLELNGPITWTFYPWFGMTIENINARGPNGTIQAERLEGSISLLALFSEIIVIDRLKAVKPQIKLQLASSNTIAPTKQEWPKSPTVVIRELIIDDGEIRGVTPGLALNQVNLSVEELDPSSESRLNLDARINYRDVVLPLNISAGIIPGTNFESLTIQDLRLTSRSLRLTLDGYLSASKRGQFAAEGTIELSEFSLRKWLRAANLPMPDTTDLTTFDHLELQATMKLSDELLALQSLQLTLDDSIVQADVNLNLSPLNLNVSGTLNKLNMDRYIGSTTDKELWIATTDFDLIPGAYKFEIGALQVADTMIQKLNLEIGLQPEEITIGMMDAEIFGGLIRTSGSHLIAPQITNLSGTFDGLLLQQIPREPLLESLSGTMTGAFDLRAAGWTIADFKTSLSGPLHMNVSDGDLGAFNLSESICKSASDSSDKLSDTASVRANFNEGVANITTLTAKISGIPINGAGRFSLVSSALNVQGEASISVAELPENCSALSELRGLRVPLSCRGRILVDKLKCDIDTKSISQFAKKNLKGSTSTVVEKNQNRSLKQESQQEIQNTFKNSLGQ
ncbi:AsmA family protein [Litorivicinus sp.]|nr:AsmA family protein [Litorivicinus sp.]